MASEMELALQSEKIAQEALRKRREKEKELLEGYKGDLSGVYDATMDTAKDYLTGAKSEVKSLYDAGYSQLENLINQQSEAQMKELIRQNESKLAAQGLLGGPSGALNEALASSAGRVRMEGINKLSDYINARDSVLANVLSSTGSQLAGVEQKYGSQKGDMLSNILQSQLGLTKDEADLTNKYAMAGLDAALGTNKIQVETQAQADLNKQQADLNAAIEEARREAERRDLENRQLEWDSQYNLLVNKLMASYSNLPFNTRRSIAEQEALSQLGHRPVK